MEAPALQTLGVAAPALMLRKPIESTAPKEARRGKKKT